MSSNMYYLPCMEKCYYTEDGLYCCSVYPQENLLVSEKCQNQEFEHESQISDCTLRPSYELSKRCADAYEMESGLSSYFPVCNPDDMHASVLHESNHDSELDRSLVPLDLSADSFQELPQSEGFSKTFEHLDVHAGEHPFTCKFCEKQFSSRSSLNNHSTIHFTDRPYTCQECGKSFKRKSHLKNHLETHSSKISYNCEICKIQFHLKKELTRHMLVHSIEKSYTCEHCGKVFIKKTNLIRHLRVHTGGRDFTCDICSKTFQSKKHLTEHMDVHSTKKLHVCECLHCGKSMEGSKSPFYSQDRQDKENKTTTLKYNIPLQQEINGYDADERDTSFSVTSIYETSFQVPPPDNVEHDISTNFGGACSSNVFPMSSRFLIAPAAESRSGTPDSVFPCSFLNANPDYTLRIL